MVNRYKGLEDTSKLYRKIKPKTVKYNNQNWSILFERDGISHMVRLTGKGLPYGVVEKIPTSQIFI